MKTLKLFAAAASLAVVLCGAAFADTVALWNYNGSNPNPVSGSGTQSIVGSCVFSAYVSDSGSTDPTPSTTGAYNTNTYNGATGSGLKWMVSTVGYDNISLKADLKRSSTGPLTMQWSYTLDGTNWVPDGTADISMVGGVYSSTAWTTMNFDLSSISGAANNANFGFKLTNTVVSGSQSGTLRFDMVTVNGTAVPEPGTIMAFGSVLAGIGGMFIRRRK